MVANRLLQVVVNRLHKRLLHANAFSGCEATGGDQGAAGSGVLHDAKRPTTIESHAREHLVEAPRAAIAREHEQAAGIAVAGAHDDVSTHTHGRPLEVTFETVVILQYSTDR